MCNHMATGRACQSARAHAQPPAAMIPPTRHVECVHVVLWASHGGASTEHIHAVAKHARGVRVARGWSGSLHTRLGPGGR